MEGVAEDGVAPPRAWSLPPEGSSPFDKPPLELRAADVWDMAASLGEALQLLVSSRGVEVPGDCASSHGGGCRAKIEDGGRVASAGGPRDCAQVAAPLAWLVVRALEALEAHVAHAGSAAREAHALRRDIERAAAERERRGLREREHLQYLEQAEELWRQESSELREKLANSERERARLERALVLSQTPVEDLSHDAWDPEDMVQLQNERDAAEKKVKARERELRERERDLKHKEQELRETERELALSQRETKALQLQVSRLVCMNSELRRQKSCLVLPAAELEARKKLFPDSPVLGSERKTGLQKNQTDMETLQQVTADAAQALLKTPQKIDQKPPMELNQQPKVDAGSTANEPGNSNAPQNAGENRESPRYTVRELRQVLEERNQLKTELLSLQEELQLYKGDAGEEDTELADSSPVQKAHGVIRDVSSMLFQQDHQSEAHIKRLIFTAIMPLVAAGVLYDDPTLQPIRNFVSDV